MPTYSVLAKAAPCGWTPRAQKTDQSGVVVAHHLADDDRLVYDCWIARVLADPRLFSSVTVELNITASIFTPSSAMRVDACLDDHVMHGHTAADVAVSRRPRSTRTWKLLPAAFWIA